MSQKHTVRQGECLITIARQYGFRDYRTVYEHPDNEPLRKKRPNPNILHPGDVVVIPDLRTRVEKVATGATHRFRVVVPKRALHLQLRDHDGNPLAGEPYVLEVDDEPPREGKQTDGAGHLKERIPLSCKGATLAIKGRRLRLRFGHLNPARDTPEGDVSGLQARLHNLGYDVGRTHGASGRTTRAALAAFQADEGLDITGEPDDRTVAKLEKLHGS